MNKYQVHGFAIAAATIAFTPAFAGPSVGQLSVPVLTAPKVAQSQREHIQPDPKGYISVLRQWQSAGSTEASAELGMLYWKGAVEMGVTPKPQEAISLLKEAANRGHGPAARQIGDIQWYGDRVQADRNSAIGWYQVAARNGDALAALRLGEIYENGEGVDVDQSAAANYYRVAANTRVAPSAEAQSRLGYWYLLGSNGLPKNAQLGLSYLAAAAGQGFPKAKYNYAVAVLAAKDRSKESQALEWLKEAADSGHENAAYLTASIYTAGKYVPQSLDEAQRYASLAGSSDKAVSLRNEISDAITGHAVEHASILDAVAIAARRAARVREGRQQEVTEIVTGMRRLAEKNRAEQADKRAKSIVVRQAAKQTLESLLARDRQDSAQRTFTADEVITAHLTNLSAGAVATKNGFALPSRGALETEAQAKIRKELSSAASEMTSARAARHEPVLSAIAEQAERAMNNAADRRRSAERASAQIVSMVSDTSLVRDHLTLAAGEIADQRQSRYTADKKAAESAVDRYAGAQSAERSIVRTRLTEDAKQTQHEYRSRLEAPAKDLHAWATTSLKQEEQSRDSRANKAAAMLRGMMRRDSDIERNDSQIRENRIENVFQILSSHVSGIGVTQNFESELSQTANERDLAPGAKAVVAAYEKLSEQVSRKNGEGFLEQPRQR